jgi:beta-N-acetylhexosaminidase
VLTQASVASDGVSEAGVDAAALQALFSDFADVRFDTVPSLLHGPWPAADGRFTVLVSNHRSRYAAPGQPRPPADLHLALWNPYQALDIAAPTLLSWGYAPGALAAVAAWLGGDAPAPGHLPVQMSGVAA